MSAGPLTVAPEFELDSVAGGPARLADLRAGGPVVLVFVADECPTSLMTLRRLAPLVATLAAAGIALVAVFEDPLEVAARTARRAGFAGLVLSEPPPYDVSRAYELQSVPTSVLIDRDGTAVGRVVGWDADALDQLMAHACERVDAPAVEVTDDAPRRKPGCAAKSTYDEDTLRLLGFFQDVADLLQRRNFGDDPLSQQKADLVDHHQLAGIGDRDGESAVARLFQRNEVVAEHQVHWDFLEQIVLQLEAVQVDKLAPVAPGDILRAIGFRGRLIGRHAADLCSVAAVHDTWFLFRHC